tara:strand:- start:7250 stop:7798 length:549 start_codon:yes stop_codon:yes gene_type:complete
MPDLSPHFPLKPSRTHEVCGSNALSFAFASAGKMGGSVMWVSESWRAEQLYPLGFSAYLDVQNLLTAKVKDQDEGLAVAEESLRSGVISLTVIELTKPFSFTAGRRLQLAAGMGRSTGLCVIPEGMGNNAAESRWRATPLLDLKDSTLQRWEIIKNKSGTLSAWDVRWDAETRRVIVVRETA